MKVIKMLSNTTYGSDRKTLLKLHDALVTSVSSYGMIALNNITKEQDKKLTTVHIRSLKYAIGAFVTSPNKSVEVEAGVFPLKHQRQVQRTKYACKTLTNKKHPIFTSLIDDTNDQKYSQRSKPPITYKLRQDLNLFNIDKNTTINKTQLTHYPPWTKTKHKFDTTLTKFDKTNTPRDVLKTEFNDRLDKYRQANFETYYTDGSKTDDGYGCAVIEGSEVHRYKCHLYSSVYSTELFAISKALRLADIKKKPKIVICTDSLSAVIGIQDRQTKHPLVMEIQDQLMTTNSQAILMWVPSHVGIIGNEKADVEAKQATKELLCRHYRIVHTDIDRNIKERARHTWQTEWNEEINRQNKLGNVKKTVDRWKTIDFLSRKDQTVLTRLRIGHTRLTHGHLIERTIAPTCTCTEPITVVHIFNCRLNRQLMDKYKVNYDTLKTDNKDELLKVVEFLKELDIYDKI
jgi:ribonuclease HI